jgi:hypothetical protein
VRIPLALLLILGGIFSFLPVLGLWMLPLDLLLIAQDLPFLQRPLAKGLGWGERKWTEWQNRRRQPPGEAERNEFAARHHRSDRDGRGIAVVDRAQHEQAGPADRNRSDAYGDRGRAAGSKRRMALTHAP